MAFSLDVYKNMESTKEHTLEEVVESLTMMRDGTESNLKNLELFGFEPEAEVTLQVKYETLAIALALVKSIKE